MSEGIKSSGWPWLPNRSLEIRSKATICQHHHLCAQCALCDYLHRKSQLRLGLYTEYVSGLFYVEWCPLCVRVGSHLVLKPRPNVQKHIWFVVGLHQILATLSKGQKVYQNKWMHTLIYLRINEMMTTNHQYFFEITRFQDYLGKMALKYNLHLTLFCMEHKDIIVKWVFSGCSLFV